MNSIFDHHPEELAWDLGFRRFSGLPILLVKSRAYLGDSEKASFKGTYYDCALSSIGEAAGVFPHDISIPLSHKEFMVYRNTADQLVKANLLYKGLFYLALGHSVAYRLSDKSFINHLESIVNTRSDTNTVQDSRSFNERYNYVHVSIENVAKHLLDAGAFFIDSRGKLS